MTKCVVCGIEIVGVLSEYNNKCAKCVTKNDAIEAVERYVRQEKETKSTRVENRKTN